MSKPVCVVVGVGPGNGAAFARRFSAEGYAVALLSRSTGLTSALAEQLPSAIALPCDVTDAAAIEGAFAAVRERLGEIDCPALAIVGEQDAISPPAEMRAIADAMPKAELVEIAKAGHMAPLENPAAVNEALSKFVQSL